MRIDSHHIGIGTTNTLQPAPLDIKNSLINVVAESMYSIVTIPHIFQLWVPVRSRDHIN